MNKSISSLQGEENAEFIPLREDEGSINLEKGVGGAKPLMTRSI